MLRYSHPARHGQAPSLRRWPGSWRNTLSHCNQVRPFSLMLSGSRTHCRPIAIGNQKAQNSCFTCTCSAVAPANFNWWLVKVEVLENIVAEPVAVCTPQSMSPNFAISVLNSYLAPPKNTWSRCQSCRLSHRNILPNVCGPMTSGAPVGISLHTLGNGIAPSTSHSSPAHGSRCILSQRLTSPASRRSRWISEFRIAS